MTKEQRRGVRADLDDLRAYVIEQDNYILTKGMAAYKFGWASSKVTNMFKYADELFEDLSLITRGALMFLGPYAEKEDGE